MFVGLWLGVVLLGVVLLFGLGVLFYSNIVWACSTLMSVSVRLVLSCGLVVLIWIVRCCSLAARSMFLICWLFIMCGSVWMLILVFMVWW